MPPVEKAVAAVAAALEAGGAASGSSDALHAAAARELLALEDEQAWNVLLEALNAESALRRTLSAERMKAFLELCEWVAFGGQCPKATAQAIRNNPVTSGGRCNQIWLNVHVAYRCKDCGTTESSCMCAECFDPDEHKGHDFRMYRSGSGGCCDCGDPNAWKPSGYCKRHRASTSSIEEAVAALEPQVLRGMKIVASLLVFDLAVSTSDLLSLFEGQIWVTQPPSKPKELCDRKLLRMSSFEAVGTQHFHVTQGDFYFKRKQNVVQLIEMLVKFCELSPAFRRIVGDEIAASIPACRISPLKILIVFGIFLDQEVQELIGVLFLRLLIDEKVKSAYSRVFLVHYGYIVDNYIYGSVKVRENITRFLDRILCQLCNSSVQVAELVTGDPQDMLGIITDRILHIAINNSKPRRFDIVGIPSNIMRATRYDMLTGTEMHRVRQARILRHRLAEHSRGDMEENLHMTTTEIDATTTNEPGRGEDGQIQESEADTTSILGMYRNEYSDTPQVDRQMYRKLGTDGGFPPRANSVLSEVNYTVDCNLPNVKGRLIDRLVMDLRLLFVHPVVIKQVVTCRDDVLTKVVNVLKLLQEMNPSVRKTGHYVMYENREEWEAAFVLELDLGWTIFRIVNGFKDMMQATAPAYRPLIIDRVLGKTTSILVEWLRRQGMTATRFLNPSFGTSSHESDVQAAIVASMVHKVSSPKYVTSVHIPLHRFWANLIQVTLPFIDNLTTLRTVLNADEESCGLPDGEKNSAEVLLSSALGVKSALPQGFAVFVAEHPLRVIVKMAQINAKMWVRNGEYVDFEPLQYVFKSWSASGLCMDLLLLQYAASSMEGDTFTRLLAKRFELEDSLTYADALNVGEHRKPPDSAAPKEKYRFDRRALERPTNDQLALLCESFFQQLGILIHNRSGTGETCEEKLRKQVIHILASGVDGKRTFSAIENQVHPGLLEKLKLEPVLESVADFISPAVNDTEGVYVLRDSLWFSEVNLYFAQYNMEQQHKVEGHYAAILSRKRKRSIDGSVESEAGSEASPSLDTEHSLAELFTPSLDAKVYHSFARIPKNILWNPELHGYLFRVLHANVLAGDKESKVTGVLARPGILVEALRLLFQAVYLAKQVSVSKALDAETKRIAAARCNKSPGADCASPRGFGETRPRGGVTSPRKHSNSCDGSVTWTWPDSELQQAFSPPNDLRISSIALNHQVDGLQPRVRLPFFNPILNVCEVIPFKKGRQNAHRNGPFKKESDEDLNAFQDTSKVECAQASVSSGSRHDWAGLTNSTMDAMEVSSSSDKETPIHRGTALLDLPEPLLSATPTTEVAEGITSTGLSLLLLLLQLEHENKWGKHVHDLVTRILRDVTESMGEVSPGTKVLVEKFRAVSKQTTTSSQRRRTASSRSNSISVFKDKAKNKRKKKKKTEALPATGSSESHGGDGGDTNAAPRLGGSKPLKRRKHQDQVLAEFARRQANFLRSQHTENSEVRSTDSPIESQSPELKGDETPSRSFSHEELDCALCRDVGCEEKPLGMAAYACQGSVSQAQNEQFWSGPAQLSSSEPGPTVFEGITQVRAGLDEMIRSLDCADDQGTPGSEESTNSPNHQSVLIRGCGHYLHYECLTAYQQSLGTASDIININNGEFRCPTCRSIANVLLPRASSGASPPDILVSDFWRKIISFRYLGHSSNEDAPLALHELSSCIAENVKMLLSHVNFKGSIQSQALETLQLLIASVRQYVAAEYSLALREDLEIVALRALENPSTHDTLDGRSILNSLIEACIIQAPDQSSGIEYRMIDLAIGRLLFGLAICRNVSDVARIQESMLTAKEVKACYQSLAKMPTSPGPNQEDDLVGTSLSEIYSALEAEIDASFPNGAIAQVPFELRNTFQDVDMTSEIAIWQSFAPFMQHIGAVLHLFNKQDHALSSVGILAQNSLEPLEYKWAIDIAAVAKIALAHIRTLKSVTQSIPHGRESLASLVCMPHLLTFLPARYNSIVQLPKQHSTLYLRFCGTGQSAFMCSRCEKPVGTETSLVCLPCGFIICVSCRSGIQGTSEILSKHAATCRRVVCKGVCAFMPATMGSVHILVDQSRIIHFRSLYLDAHGEADPSLRRGKQLYLDALRVQQLDLLTFGMEFCTNTISLRRILGATIS